MGEVSPAEAHRDTLQLNVHHWMLACFGEELARNTTERVRRFIEESLELAQALNFTAEEAHFLVDYVFARPRDAAVQEVGGAMLTLAALCSAIGIDMNAAAEAELQRAWSKIEEIRVKQRAKPRPHVWGPSNLGHGEAMCVNCFITNREAAVLGQLHICTPKDLP